MGKTLWEAKAADKISKLDKCQAGDLARPESICNTHQIGSNFGIIFIAKFSYLTKARYEFNLDLKHFDVFQSKNLSASQFIVKLPNTSQARGFGAGFWTRR